MTLFLKLPNPFTILIEIAELISPFNAEEAIAGVGDIFELRLKEEFSGKVGEASKALDTYAS